MELDWIIFSSIQSQQHDCRFGCGNPPTPAAHSAVGLHGVRHRRHRTRHRPLALQRRENVQPEIQPNRRSRTRVPLQIHSQRTLDSLLHQSYISLNHLRVKTSIKLNSNDAVFFFSFQPERRNATVSTSIISQRKSTVPIPMTRHSQSLVREVLLLFRAPNGYALMFIYFDSNRCGLEVGSVLFHGHRSVGCRRDFLFPRTLCTEETLLHFSIRRHFYPFRYFISIELF